jgi:hypothetical protein
VESLVQETFTARTGCVVSGKCPRHDMPQRASNKFEVILAVARSIELL